MRRILFYTILFIQACTIVFLVVQFERIEQVGTEIKLVTLDEKELYGYDYQLIEDAYLEYEITRIPKEKWSGPSDLNYSEIVYVLLQRGEDGIYEVEKASRKKMDVEDNHSIIITGQYNFYDEHTKEYWINYDFQHIKNIERFGKFSYSDNLIVTLLLSKWNQHKVKDVSLFNG